MIGACAHVQLLGSFGHDDRRIPSSGKRKERELTDESDVMWCAFIAGVENPISPTSGGGVTSEGDSYILEKVRAHTTG